MIDHPEGHTTVHPCLRSVPCAALLSTQEKQRLHGRDGGNTLGDLVEDHGPGMSAKDGAAVVIILETLAGGLVPAAPADRVREHCVKEGVGVIWPEELHVTGEGWPVDEVPQGMYPAPMGVEEVLKGFLENQDQDG